VHYCTILKKHWNVSIECIDIILAEFHENPLIDSVLTRRRQGESGGCNLVTRSYERALKCRVARNFSSFMRCMNAFCLI